jgi:hypothetical protein
MKSYQEIMIEKYADELTEALRTDLNKACKILTKIFKGTTIGEMQDLFDQLNESGNDCSLINDCFCCGDGILLKGTRPGTTHAYGRISDIMETLHYDNGLPLTGYNYPKDNPTEWHDFFEHYDRDQDLWGFYWDDEVYNFCTDGKGIYVRIDYSLSDLKSCLEVNYDGASWEHDFNRKW